MRTKIVIVMRTDLDISPGLMVAAGSRAALKGYREAVHAPLSRNDLSDWLNNGCPQVCVQCGSLEELKALEQLAVHRGFLCFNSKLDDEIVCISIGPNASEHVDQITGKLSLL